MKAISLLGMRAIGKFHDCIAVMGLAAILGTGTTGTLAEYGKGTDPLNRNRLTEVVMAAIMRKHPH